jgi:GT2 family glycosyltransferase
MLKNHSFVSVVIVNYNGFDHLKKCVASLLRSEYPLYEIIIVDNGSIDGSISKIRKEFEEHKDRIVILDLMNNLGFAIGNRIGANKALGKYILFLNNDTKVESSTLCELASVMDRDPSIGVAQAKILRMDKPDTFDCAGAIMNVFGVSSPLGANEKDIGQYDQVDEISYAKGAAMMVRKEIWNRLDGFDPLFFVYCEESDFCWRVWLSGYRVVFAPSATVYHVGSATTKKLRPLYSERARYFMFQYYRNQIVTVAKNLSLKNLFKYTPGLVGLNLIQIGLLISRNEPLFLLDNLHGYAWCLLFFKKVWVKRLAVQGRRVVNDGNLFKRGAILQRAMI